MQPHRRYLPEKYRLSEKAITTLGRLNLTGSIDDQQHEAGRLYALDCGAYFSSIGVPTGLAGGGGSYPCKGEASCRDCECRRRKSRYDSAFIALMDAGQQSAKVVAHIAVHDKWLGRDKMPLLIRGLNALVQHYGLTSDRKSLTYRNTN